MDYMTRAAGGQRGHRVRAAHKADVRDISGVLARAFGDDPVTTWMFPDPQERERRLPAMFSSLLRYQHLRHGGVQLAVDEEGRIGGAALWDPPGRWKNPAWRELLAMPSYARVFGKRIQVASETIGGIEAAHPAEPHWYLASIGTDPSFQGQGIGSTLLRYQLAECDRRDLPAYLESTKAANVPYYERFGFRVARTIPIPGGGPTCWALWRPARNGNHKLAEA
ncbi:GNAT family N-acetyltransferase [Streptomyces sp. NPDC058251]|uniref:GNAT family N-acetyltransferase n=1 Tax=unclassified Streptomyces TaxID=2593676 RepID=UPI003657A62C